MSDLTLKIKTLKDQLNNLEINFDVNDKHMQRREDVNIRLENKLDNLLKVNQKSNVLYVNAGGKVFQTTRDCVNNCLYPNLLQEKIASSDSGFSPEDPIFVNIPKEYFKVIIDIMRRLNNQNLKDTGSFACFILESEQHKYTFNLQSNFASRFNFETFIKKFFNDDETVLEVISIVDRRRINAAFKAEELKREKNKKKKNK